MPLKKKRMDLDVDQFQNALERLKSIVQDDSSGSINNSVKKVYNRVKSRQHQQQISLSNNNNNRNFIDDEAFASSHRNPIRERLRTNLDMFESEMSIGKSVLNSSKYAAQLGFKQQQQEQNNSSSFSYYDSVSLARSSSLNHRKQLITSSFSIKDPLKNSAHLKQNRNQQKPTFFLSKYGRNLTYANLRTIDDKFSQEPSTSIRQEAHHKTAIIRDEQLQQQQQQQQQQLSSIESHPITKTKKLNSAPPNSFLQRLNDELYKLEIEKKNQHERVVLKELNDFDIFSPSNDSEFKQHEGQFENLTLINRDNESRNLSLPMTNDSNNTTLVNNATTITSSTKKKPMRLKRVVNIEALTRFKKAVKMITILLKAISSIKKDNQAELNNGETYQKVDMYGLIFDVNHYKKPKEIGLTDEAKRILKMPVEKRSEEQIKIAVSSLLEAVPEYQDFPINMQKSIASVSVLQEFEAGRVIIRQDHKADNFYFIVSGMTAVSVSEHNSFTGEPSSKVVAYLSKGRSFGELAIIHASKRNATVTCSTNVSILCIEREDFIDIFMHYEKGQEPEHITFLREIDVLRGWPIEKLPYNDHRICLITYFRKGILMCKDSNKNDWIYVIKQGTCRIIKDIPLSKQSISTIEQSIEVANKSMEFGRKSARETPRNEAVASAKQQGNIYKMLKNKSVYTEVLQLGVKDTFGLVDVLFGSIEGATSVSLVSDGAECILISKSFFSKHLPDEMRKKLRETVAPYPKDIEIQKKFLNNIYWQTYKKNTINEIYKKMDITAV